MKNTFETDAYKEDSAQKCCFKIPLETGMKIFGRIIMINLIIFLGILLYVFTTPFWYMGLVFLLVFAPALYVFFNWYKWLSEDNAENTARLV